MNCLVGNRVRVRFVMTAQLVFTLLPVQSTSVVNVMHFIATFRARPERKFIRSLQIKLRRAD